VKDIALSHPAARRVLEEAPVDYCCGGGRSLQKACATTEEHKCMITLGDQERL